MKKIFFLSLLFIVLKSYSQEPIDSLVSVESDGISYSIYIPKGDENKMKTLFFFDPSANGSRPVRKFKEVADKHSLILIGSNDSRNGSMEVSFEIMDRVIEHSIKNFKVDKDRMLFSGFSGGSRTSAMYASIRNNSIGVIGCGSGFQPEFNLSTLTFPYVGIIGNRDMNYLEMIGNEEKLDELEISNFLVEFDGIHRWPDVKSFNAGVSWLVGNEGGNPYFKEFLLEKIDSLKEEGKLSSLARHEKRASKVGIMLAQKLDLNSKEFLKEEKDVAKIYTKEEELKEEVLNSFTAIKYSKAYASSDLKEFSWWQGHYGRLSSQAKKNDEKGYSAKRLLNFFGANSYERGYFSLVGGDFELSEKYFEIYDLFTDNWFGALWMARVNAVGQRWDDCSKYLKISIKKGLQNPESLKKDPYFQDENAQKIITDLAISD